jgi:short-subunit dehydrogenase
MNSIFITGGARGIGMETARIFLDAGWLVGIYDADQVAIDEMQKVLPSERLYRYQGDVLDAARLDEALKGFTSRSDHQLHVLHNNVGILEVGEFAEQSLEQHLKIVDINLKGYLTTTYTALPYLKAAQGAKIINMSSASAIYGNPEITTYAATKAAIKSLTEGWQLAFRKYDISVSDLLPIYVRTRMVDDYYQKYRNLKLKDVKLTAPKVARVVWKAAHGKRAHYYVGADTKVFARLVKWIPEVWLPAITRKVLKYYD